MVRDPAIQLVLGGSWHDFARFLERVAPPIAHAGFSLQWSFDLNALTRLDQTGANVVLLYTCLDEASPLAHTPPQLAALMQWVEQGGGLFAMHSTAVAARKEAALRALLGGSFLSHPPKRRFEVTPLGKHPITEGVGAFEIEDEPYQLEHAPDVHVHAASIDQGNTQPSLWSRRAQNGKVAYLALGHDESAWHIEPFERLMVQAIRWVATARD